MSWTDDEIDELYRERSERLSFEYKDAYWKEFEASLGKRKKRFGGWFYLSMIAILLVGGAGIITYFGTTNDVDGEQIRQNAQTKTINNDVNQDSKSTSANSGPVANPVQQRAQRPTTPAQGTSNDAGTNVNRGVQDNQGMNTPVLRASLLSGIPQEEHAATNYEIESPVNAALPVETDNSIRTAVEEVQFVLEPSDRVMATSENELSGLESKTEIGNLATVAAREVDGDDKVLALWQDRKDAVKEFSYRLYGQASGGISQSLITPSSELSYNYGLGAGIGIRRGNFVLNGGVSFFSSQHNELVLTRTAKVYGFGSTLYNYTITFDKLFQLEGHVELGWIKGRSEFKVGVRPSYLISTKMKFTESVSNGLEQEAVNARQTYGYTDGLVKFGLKPSLGYQFAVTPSLAIGLNVGCQVRSMVDERYIKGSNNKLPIDAQITLRKYFNLRQ